MGLGFRDLMLGGIGFMGLGLENDSEPELHLRTRSGGYNLLACQRTTQA